MLSLSTCWRARSGLSGTEIVDLFRNLGVREMEVEYRLDTAQVNEIERAVEAGKIRVTSLHNYVPRILGEGLATDGGDRFLLSSLVESERTEAVRKTCRTLEWAERLGAGTVVLHLGRVEGRVSQRPLLDLFRAGHGASDEADNIRTDLIKQRAREAEPYVAKVLKSVRDIEKRAADMGLRLGLENRYYYRQIPSPDELGVLLSETNPDVVGYWHDVGHGQVMEALGLRGSLEHIEVETA